MTRTVSLGPDGFTVSDDIDFLLATFLATALRRHANELTTLFAPNGEGYYIPSLGGAQRIEDRDSLRPPYDSDPELDPARMELWAIERERAFHAPIQIVMSGDELRAMLTEAQQLKLQNNAD